MSDNTTYETDKISSDDVLYETDKISSDDVLYETDKISLDDISLDKEIDEEIAEETNEETDEEEVDEEIDEQETDEEIDEETTYEDEEEGDAEIDEEETDEEIDEETNDLPFDTADEIIEFYDELLEFSTFAENSNVYSIMLEIYRSETPVCISYGLEYIEGDRKNYLYSRSALVVVSDSGDFTLYDTDGDNQEDIPFDIEYGQKIGVLYLDEFENLIRYIIDNCKLLVPTWESKEITND